MSLFARSHSEPRGFIPGVALTGVFRPPASKSLAQRVVLAAAFSEGRVAISGLGAAAEFGEDVRASLELARGIGARVEQDAVSGVWRIEGVRPHGIRYVGDRMELGESATLARLATALCALLAPPGAQVVLHPRGTLRNRRSDPLLEALGRAGARVQASDPDSCGAWPVAVRSPEARGGAEGPRRWELHRPVSSQEVSGLWLAAAALAGETFLTVRGEIPSRPYLQMTGRVLRAFGARVEDLESRPDFLHTRLVGPLTAPAAFLLEPDASSAAVVLVAGCLSGGEVSVEGIGPDSPQGDGAIVGYLERFGCRTERGAGRLRATGLPGRGCTLDLHGEPDLAALLAVVAACAASRSGETSRLTGLGVLAHKESDRLAGLAAGLTAAGWSAEVQGASLHIGPGRGGTHEELVLDPRGDHRMAFAFALLGLLRPGIRVQGPECVAKSWPRFWEACGPLQG